MTWLSDARFITDAATDSEWSAYFTTHGDAHVIGSELSKLRPGGKPAFPQDLLATISAARNEYGRSDAEFIATFDPPTVAAMLDALEAAERMNEHCFAETDAGMAAMDDADAALARVRDLMEADRD